MIAITKQHVFLQYGREGEPTSNFNKVHASEAEKFVALDSASGGYPCATEIGSAYDFQTVEKALKYSGGFTGFHPRVVTVKFTYTQEERLQQCRACHGLGASSSIVDHDADYNTVWESRTCGLCGGSGKSET